MINSHTPDLTIALVTDTMGLGIGGAGFALGAALIGSAYEKLSNASTLDGLSLVPRFNAGEILFARKQDVICHEIQLKEGLLSPTSYRVAIAGNFSHVRHEEIDLALYIIEPEILKPLRRAGWEIRSTGKKYTKFFLAGQALAPRYLDSGHHQQILSRAHLGKGH